jgi:hypothetical protein
VTWLGGAGAEMLGEAASEVVEGAEVRNGAPPGIPVRFILIPGRAGGLVGCDGG